MAMEHRRSLYGHTIKDTHTLFESLDRDGSGFLSPDEIRDGLHRLGLNFADHDFDMLMRHAHFDENQDGEISIEEFTKLLHGTRRFKTPTSKSRLGAAVLKSVKHSGREKRNVLKKKKAKNISSEGKNSPNRFVRPDIGAQQSRSTDGG